MATLYAQLAAIILSAIALGLLGTLAAMIFEPDELPAVRPASTAYVYLIAVPTIIR